MNLLQYGLDLLVLTQPRLLVLAALLFVAALVDFHQWRIPNALTFGGALGAFLLSVIEPGPATQALLTAAAGLAAGLALMLPLYLMRALGAGDVKLMGMVGAYLGLPHTLGAVLLVFITGGVMASLLVLYRRGWQVSPTQPSADEVTGTSLGRMPYGTSIALGTLVYVCAFEPAGLQWSRWLAA
jgi:prepilin peptidase CpaA